MKIKEFILYTQNLEKQTKFYSMDLGLKIRHQDEKRCSFNAGKSILTFEVSENSTPYHFALNIPSNKDEEAHTWLKQRVELLNFEGKEIVNFESWNAKALYFYDADKNIVEFIARKNLNLNSPESFSSKSILNISEIGIGTTTLKKTFDKINSLKTIDLYSGNFDRFCALGNEEGMFILANPTQKKWFPCNDTIQQSDFAIKGDYNFEFKNGSFIEIN